MRIARVSCGGEVFYGELKDDKVKRIIGQPYENIQFDGREYLLSDVKLLAPVEPRTVLCVGRNYYAHIMELGHEVPEQPLLFYKPVTTIIGPGDDVRYPAISKRLDHEAELLVVIGKKASAVEKGHAAEYIFGYTCVNDITARDVQQTEKQFSRSKGCDTCCPIGPWVETELDPGDVQVTCRVNGETRQNGRTSLMMTNVDELISFITEAITLYPGDVVATGTPAGVSPMNVGDTVEVEIEGIGILRNRIV